MTNLDSILKSRDITLLTKVHIVKTMLFSVVMYGCESWTIKKAERWRIDASKLWFWRRLLRVPWTAKAKPVNLKGNQPWILIGRTDTEAPRLWPLDAKSKLIGKDPDAGQDWRQEEKETTEDETVGWHVSLSKLREIVKDREKRHAAVHRFTKSWTRLSDWTSANEASNCHIHQLVLFIYSGLGQLVSET